MSKDIQFFKKPVSKQEVLELTNQQEAGGTPSGGNGQIQYNNNGTFGGFTVGGEATLDPTTGELVIADEVIKTKKIADCNVTLPKISNATANNILLGSGNAGANAAYSEIALGEGLTMTGNTLSAPASGGGGARVYASFSSAGGTITLGETKNVSGITLNANGIYTITFTTPLANSNYPVQMSASDGAVGTGVDTCIFTRCGPTDKTTTTVKCGTIDQNLAAFVNCDSISVTIP